MAISEKKLLTTEVPLSLVQRLDSQAARLDRPRDELVCEALEHWLERENELDHLTRAGMDDVDAGRTVPHDEVLAWVDSLQADVPLPAPMIK